MPLRLGLCGEADEKKKGEGGLISGQRHCSPAFKGMEVARREQMGTDWDSTVECGGKERRSAESSKACAPWPSVR